MSSGIILVVKNTTTINTPAAEACQETAPQRYEEKHLPFEQGKNPDHPDGAFSFHCYVLSLES
ncbi:MAG: hypothetical protein ACYSWU_27980, partial [Planctomycetota bacterium]